MPRVVMRIVEETATRIRRGRLDEICRVAFTPAIRGTEFACEGLPR